MILLVLRDPWYKTVTTKMELDRSDRISWERQYYCDIIIPGGPKSIKCTTCGAVFPDGEKQTPYLISHLYAVHDITELTHHLQRDFFEQKFLINVVISTAKCRICEKNIEYSQHGLYLLKNHVEIYHEENLRTYELITKTKGGRDILDKYFITGNEAMCTKCDRKIDMTQSIPAEKVKELLEHYLSHKSEDIHQKNIVYINKLKNEVKKIKEQQKSEEWKLRKRLRLHREKEKKLLRTTSDLNKITESGRTVPNEPGPSTSSSTADDRTERSEQSGVPQNIPKRRKSSTLDETQLKRKEKE